MCSWRLIDNVDDEEKTDDESRPSRRKRGYSSPSSGTSSFSSLSSEFKKDTFQSKSPSPHQAYGSSLGISHEHKPLTHDASYFRRNPAELSVVTGQRGQTLGSSRLVTRAPVDLPLCGDDFDTASDSCDFQTPGVPLRGQAEGGHSVLTGNRSDLLTQPVDSLSSHTGHEVGRKFRKNPIFLASSHDFSSLENVHNDPDDLTDSSLEDVEFVGVEGNSDLFLNLSSDSGDTNKPEYRNILSNDNYRLFGAHGTRMEDRNNDDSEDNELFARESDGDEFDDDDREPRDLNSGEQLFCCSMLEPITEEDSDDMTESSACDGSKSWSDHGSYNPRNREVEYNLEQEERKRGIPAANTLGVKPIYSVKNASSFEINKNATSLEINKNANIFTTLNTPSTFSQTPATRLSNRLRVADRHSAIVTDVNSQQASGPDYQAVTGNGTGRTPYSDAVTNSSTPAFGAPNNRDSYVLYTNAYYEHIRSHGSSVDQLPSNFVSLDTFQDKFSNSSDQDRLPLAGERQNVINLSVFSVAERDHVVPEFKLDSCENNSKVVNSDGNNALLTSRTVNVVAGDDSKPASGQGLVSGLRPVPIKTRRPVSDGFAHVSKRRKSEEEREAFYRDRVVSEGGGVAFGEDRRGDGSEQFDLEHDDSYLHDSCDSGFQPEKLQSNVNKVESSTTTAAKSNNNVLKQSQNGVIINTRSHDSSKEITTRAKSNFVSETRVESPIVKQNASSEEGRNNKALTDKGRSLISNGRATTTLIASDLKNTKVLKNVTCVDSLISSQDTYKNSVDMMDGREYFSSEYVDDRDSDVSIRRDGNATETETEWEETITETFIVPVSHEIAIMRTLQSVKDLLDRRSALRRSELIPRDVEEDEVEGVNVVEEVKEVEEVNEVIEVGEENEEGACVTNMIEVDGHDEVGFRGDDDVSSGYREQYDAVARMDRDLKGKLGFQLNLDEFKTDEYNTESGWPIVRYIEKERFYVEDNGRDSIEYERHRDSDMFGGNDFHDGRGLEGDADVVTEEDEEEESKDVKDNEDVAMDDDGYNEEDEDDVDEQIETRKRDVVEVRDNQDYHDFTEGLPREYMPRVAFPISEKVLVVDTNEFPRHRPDPQPPADNIPEMMSQRPEYHSTPSKDRFTRLSHGEYNSPTFTLPPSPVVKEERTPYGRGFSSEIPRRHESVFHTESQSYTTQSRTTSAATADAYLYEEPFDQLSSCGSDLPPGVDYLRVDYEDFVRDMSSKDLVASQIQEERFSNLTPDPGSAILSGNLATPHKMKEVFVFPKEDINERLLSSVQVPMKDDSKERGEKRSDEVSGEQNAPVKKPRLIRTSTAQDEDELLGRKSIPRRSSTNSLYDDSTGVLNRSFEDNSSNSFALERLDSEPGLTRNRSRDSLSRSRSREALLPESPIVEYRSFPESPRKFYTQRFFGEPVLDVVLESIPSGHQVDRAGSSSTDSAPATPMTSRTVTSSLSDKSPKTPTSPQKRGSEAVASPPNRSPTIHMPPQTKASELVSSPHIKAPTKPTSPQTHGPGSVTSQPNKVDITTLSPRTPETPLMTPPSPKSLNKPTSPHRTETPLMTPPSPKSPLNKPTSPHRTETPLMTPPSPKSPLNKPTSPHTKESQSSPPQRASDTPTSPHTKESDPQPVVWTRVIPGSNFVEEKRSPERKRAASNTSSDQIDGVHPTTTTSPKLYPEEVSDLEFADADDSRDKFSVSALRKVAPVITATSSPTKVAPVITATSSPTKVAPVITATSSPTKIAPVITATSSPTKVAPVISATSSPTKVAPVITATSSPTKVAPVITATSSQRKVVPVITTPSSPTKTAPFITTASSPSKLAPAIITDSSPTKLAPVITDSSPTKLAPVITQSNVQPKPTSIKARPTTAPPKPPMAPKPRTSLSSESSQEVSVTTRVEGTLGMSDHRNNSVEPKPQVRVDTTTTSNTFTSTPAANLRQTQATSSQTKLHVTPILPKPTHERTQVALPPGKSSIGPTPVVPTQKRIVVTPPSAESSAVPTPPASSHQRNLVKSPEKSPTSSIPLVSSQRGALIETPTRTASAASISSASSLQQRQPTVQPLHPAASAAPPAKPRLAPKPRKSSTSSSVGADSRSSTSSSVVVVDTRSSTSSSVGMDTRSPTSAHVEVVDCRSSTSSSVGMDSRSSTSSSVGMDSRSSTSSSVGADSRSSMSSSVGMDTRWSTSRHVEVVDTRFSVTPERVSPTFGIDRSEMRIELVTPTIEWIRPVKVAETEDEAQPGEMDSMDGRVHTEANHDESVEETDIDKESIEEEAEEKEEDEEEEEAQEEEEEEEEEEEKEERMANNYVDDKEETEAEIKETVSQKLVDTDTKMFSTEEFNGYKVVQEWRSAYETSSLKTSTDSYSIQHAPATRKSASSSLPPLNTGWAHSQFIPTSPHKPRSMREIKKRYKQPYKSVLTQEPTTPTSPKAAPFILPENLITPSRVKIIQSRDRFLSEENLLSDPFAREFEAHKEAMKQAASPAKDRKYVPKMSKNPDYRSHEQLEKIMYMINLKHGRSDSALNKGHVDCLHEDCILSDRGRREILDKALSMDSLHADLYRQLQQFDSETDTDGGHLRDAYFPETNSDLFDLTFPFQNDRRGFLERPASMSELRHASDYTTISGASSGYFETPGSKGKGRFAQRQQKKSKSLCTLETNLDDVGFDASSTSDGLQRVPSAHELRISKSLQKLNVPNWYKQSSLSKSGSCLLKYGSSSSMSSWAFPPSLLSSPCTTPSSTSNVVIKSRVQLPTSSRNLRSPRFASKSAPSTPSFMNLSQEEGSSTPTPVKLPSEKMRTKDKPKSLMPIPIVPFDKIRAMFESTKEGDKAQKSQKEESPAPAATPPTSSFIKAHAQRPTTMGSPKTSSVYSDEANDIEEVIPKVIVSPTDPNVKSILKRPNPEKRYSDIQEAPEADDEPVIVRPVPTKPVESAPTMVLSQAPTLASPQKPLKQQLPVKPAIKEKPIPPERPGTGKQKPTQASKDQKPAVVPKNEQATLKQQKDATEERQPSPVAKSKGFSFFKSLRSSSSSSTEDAKDKGRKSPREKGHKSPTSPASADSSYDSPDAFPASPTSRLSPPTITVTPDKSTSKNSNYVNVSVAGPREPTSAIEPVPIHKSDPSLIEERPTRAQQIITHNEPVKKDTQRNTRSPDSVQETNLDDSFESEYSSKSEVTTPDSHPEKKKSWFPRSKFSKATKSPEEPSKVTAATKDSKVSELQSKFEIQQLSDEPRRLRSPVESKGANDSFTSEGSRSAHSQRESDRSKASASFSEDSRSAPRESDLDRSRDSYSSRSGDRSRGSDRDYPDSRLPERKTSVEADRNISHGLDRASDRYISRDNDRASDRYISRDNDRASDRYISRDNDRASDRYISRDNDRASDRYISRDNDRASDRYISRDNDRASDRYISRDNDRGNARDNDRGNARGRRDSETSESADDRSGGYKGGRYSSSEDDRRAGSRDREYDRDFRSRDTVDTLRRDSRPRDDDRRDRDFDSDRDYHKRDDNRGKDFDARDRRDTDYDKRDVPARRDRDWGSREGSLYSRESDSDNRRGEADRISMSRTGGKDSDLPRDPRLRRPSDNYEDTTASRTSLGSGRSWQPKPRGGRGSEPSPPKQTSSASEEAGRTSKSSLDSNGTSSPYRYRVAGSAFNASRPNAVSGLNTPPSDRHEINASPATSAEASKSLKETTV